MSKVKLLMPLVGLIILFVSCSSPTVGPQVGKMAPDFTLTSLNGEIVSLSALRGKTVLLNFWASWCDPCCYEMPFIQQISEEYSASGLVVLAINSWEDRNTIEEFVTLSGITFSILIDYPSKKAAQSYQVRTIPVTLIIDKKGTVKRVKIGAFSSKAEIENLLKDLL